MVSLTRKARFVRTGLALLAGLSLHLVSAPDPAVAQDAVRVGKAVPHVFSFVPLDIGIANGIFAKHGIDAESIGFGGGPKMQQALIAKSIDFGLGSGPELAHLVKGAPQKAVAAMAGPPKLLTIIALKDSPINSTEDLKGKKVGLSSSGSVTEWLLRRLSDENGWGNSGIEPVALGQETAQIAALKTNQIDAMTTDVATAFRLEAAGEAKVIYRFGDLLPEFMMHVIYARQDVVDGNPDLVKRFLAAWFETIAFMKSNKAESVKSAMEVMSVPEEIASKVYDELMPMFSETGKFQPAALEILSASFVEMKLLPTKPDLSTVYTEEFLPAASN